MTREAEAKDSLVAESKAWPVSAQTPSRPYRICSLPLLFLQTSPLLSAIVRAMSVYILLLLSLVSRSVLAIDCYRPNGDLITDPAYEACNRRNAEDAGGSMCCALNRTSYPDQCLSNGLCGGGGNLFRDGCTDPTWKSPLCLKLCVEGFGESGTAIGISQGQYGFIFLMSTSLLATLYEPISFCYV